MRFREDNPAELGRARAAVAALPVGEVAVPGGQLL